MDGKTNNSLKKTIILLEGNFYIISTVNLKMLFNVAMINIQNFETMVFRCNEKGEISNYIDLDVDTYPDEKSALDGHEKILINWLAKGAVVIQY